jgi:predicted nucleic acid-binding protein
MPVSNAAFIDTSGWIGLLNADDQLHKHAAANMEQFRSTNRVIVTTDWVLAETGNGLARTPARRLLAIAIQTLLASPHCRLVRVDETLFRRALELYE